MAFAAVPTDSAIDNASTWAMSLTTGTVATTLAVLAIAGLGFAMLTGRLRVRSGGMVLLGCFILFGSAAIARSLLGISQSGQTVASPPQVNLFDPAPPPPTEPEKKQAVDPYAGAALPN